MADALVLGTSLFGGGGSTPLLGIRGKSSLKQEELPLIRKFFLIGERKLLAKPFPFLLQFQLCSPEL